MVASFTALGKHGDASSIAKYFCNRANANYFVEGGEPPGVWWGRGAVALGLVGVVRRDPFINVLAGRHPEGHRQLVQIQRRTFPGPDPNSTVAVPSDGDSVADAGRTGAAA